MHADRHTRDRERKREREREKERESQRASERQRGGRARDASKQEADFVAPSLINPQELLGRTRGGGETLLTRQTLEVSQGGILASVS